MPRQVRAAVLYEPGKPMVVETVELEGPRAGEVLVRIGATGVCHSDYHVIKGEWSLPLPMVLGHEAAGVVEEVGPGVTLVKPGDHVILNFRAHCGRCYYCNIGRPVLCDGIPTSRWVMFDGTTRLSKGAGPSTTWPGWHRLPSTRWFLRRGQSRSGKTCPWIGRPSSAAPS